MKKLILILALFLFPTIGYCDLTLQEGEGVDLTKSGSGGTLTVSGEDASTTNKGIASFNASDFDVSSGAVSIDYANGQSASGSTKGFLTSTDWTTFNNKQAAGSYLTATNIDDTAYGSGWDSDTTHAPTKNAVYDKINSLSLGGGEASTVSNTSTINLTLTGVDITANLNFDSLLEAIWFGFKSFGQAIASGTSIYKPVPFNCTVQSWEVTGTSGSTVIDILKSDYATMGTWESIAGTEIPNTTGAIKGTDTSLTTWNTTLVAGQYLMANVTSSDVVGTAKVVLKLKRR